ncbi:MAG: carbon-nitrogen hydrolase family protein, partial [Deltaproteobacteria bacterium]
MKLAAVQYRPPHGRPDRARRELARRVRAAIDAGARLVVLPEMATTGYVWPDAAALRPHAEPARGPTFEALRAEARTGGGAWVVCGFAEQADDGA